MNEFVIGALILVIVIQQVYFMRQIQMLVNKLMSGTYQNYVNAETPKPPRIKIDDLPSEDLSPLTDFS